MFTSLEKFDGTSRRGLFPAEVKQIAGRAGRFGKRFSHGVVTVLHKVSTSTSSRNLYFQIRSVMSGLGHNDLH